MVLRGVVVTIQRPTKSCLKMVLSHSKGNSITYPSCHLINASALINNMRSW